LKFKFKTSHRERWLLALAPAVAIGAIYLYGYEGKLAADLTAAKKRLAAAETPLAPPGPSQALVKAKASLEDAKHALADEQAKVDQLQARLADLSTGTGDSTDPDGAAHTMGRVEAVFARNGITPLVSENAGNAASGAPAALLAVLSPKPQAGGVNRTPRVWHYVFDDLTVHFQHALADLTRDVPGVVPLSLNFVYNPKNDGQTRELELWLLY